MMIDSEKLYELARRLDDAGDILRYTHRSEADIRKALGIVVEVADRVASEAAAMLRYEVQRDLAEQELLGKDRGKK